MTSKISAQNSGFTLIEMLVAVLLLTMAVAGPLTISSKALTVALVAKDQTIAFYLAQDAVEYVRHVRDTNSLAGRTWLAGLDGSANPDAPPQGAPDCVSADGSARCYFDSLANPVTSTFNIASCAAVCPVLQYNTTSKTYNYVSGNPTIFTRTVSITSPNAGAVNEAVLRVTVQWSDVAGIVRNITVTEDLFDWQ